MSIADIREQLWTERGEYCEYCHVNRWTDLHHCLIRRDKRFKHELDVAVNFMCVCHQCHIAGYVDGYNVRRLFYYLQEARGNDPADWIASLSLKVTPRFENEVCNTELLRSNMNLPISKLLALELF